mgnify:CR=1 FL=1
MPRVAFINKLDRMGANPWRAIEQMRSQLHVNACAVQVPIGLEEAHSGVVDLLERLPMTNTFEGDSLYVKKDDGGVEFTQLTATLVSIALCDVLFAIDSIPAVLGVANEVPEVSW